MKKIWNSIRKAGHWLLPVLFGEAVVLFFTVCFRSLEWAIAMFVFYTVVEIVLIYRTK